MFSSSTDPPTKRSTAIDTTAAGKVAATVSHAFMQRYALAAPRMIAITVLNATALNVSSGSSESSRMNSLHSMGSTYTRQCTSVQPSIFDSTGKDGKVGS